jgi:malate dehydrogenase (oxaloacetate-decarboxylating)
LPACRSTAPTACASRTRPDSSRRSRRDRRDEGLIGDITTVSVARKEAIREITVEVRDKGHMEDLATGWARWRACRSSGFTTARSSPTTAASSTSSRAARSARTRTSATSTRPASPRVSLAISEFPDLAGRFTMIGRSVAICTNGTRVLGLGDIGPVASMPVMEGKALFYAQLAGLAAVPILIDTKDVDEFVETVVRIAPGFGGIHLEDISAPECFEIERRLIEELPQPVMHDDVHGTAVVTLAAAIAGCRAAGCASTRRPSGRSAWAPRATASRRSSTTRRRAGAGVGPQPGAQAMARERGIEIASLEQLMAEADVVVATSGRPGLIEPGMVRDGQVILALTNPDPEIDPDAAIAAGAAFAADGTSVNNVLGYPGIFRGALLAGAHAINTEMKRAAAWALAG